MAIVEGDFVQYKDAPGVLLGKVESFTGPMYRVEKLPKPLKVYMNAAAVRTIEVPIVEGHEYIHVHIDDLERWSDALWILRNA